MMSFDASENICEQPCRVASHHRRLSLGLPAAAGSRERRFPLTPEAVAILVEKGVAVRIEAGAPAPIHYADAAYERVGAEIVTRDEALLCDMVIHLSAMPPADVMKMRKGSMLLTLMHSVTGNIGGLHKILDRSIICIALDLIEDRDGKTPFADILHEIDGRAVITLAAAMQADPDRGKGILMGGVAGLVPCEVVVLGSGISACAASRSALGLGATVRMFDNDVYRLRKALRYLGDSVIGSALHPHVLEGAFRSADVVVATGMRMNPQFDDDMIRCMKKRVLLFDLNDDFGHVFGGMRHVDLGLVDGHLSQAFSGAGASERVCYVNVGSRVPRTAAMAIGNAFVTLMDDVLACGDSPAMNNTLKFLPGMHPAVLTFMGKPINRELSALLGMRSVDLSLFFSLS